MEAVFGGQRETAQAGGPCKHWEMHAGKPDEPLESGDAEDSADSEADHESAYSLLQRGQELMRRRHHAQAAIVLARAARAEPGKGSILEALGRAYYNSGQHDLSRETFEALLEVDPSAHYAHYALGQSLKQLGRVKEARTHLRLAVALAPASPLYRGALDRLAARTGE
jgi:tetratricopeptide (TPR) repeat protein